MLQFTNENFKNWFSSIFNLKSILSIFGYKKILKIMAFGALDLKIERKKERKKLRKRELPVKIHP